MKVILKCEGEILLNELVEMLCSAKRGDLRHIISSVDSRLVSSPFAFRPNPNNKQYLSITNLASAVQTKLLTHSLESVQDKRTKWQQRNCPQTHVILK